MTIGGPLKVSRTGKAAPQPWGPRRASLDLALPRPGDAGGGRRSALAAALENGYFRGNIAQGLGLEPWQLVAPSPHHF